MLSDPSRPHGFVELTFSGENLLSSGVFSWSLTDSNKTFSQLKFITQSPGGRISEKMEDKERRTEMATGGALVILFAFS